MSSLMTTIDAKEKFIELINHVSHSKERIILTRRGKEIAAIIPLEDFQLLQETQDKHDVKEAIEALKETRNVGAITLEQLIKDIG